MHVGTHGLCIRSINHAICFQFPLSGRTDRASLHAYRGRIDVQNG